MQSIEELTMQELTMQELTMQELPPMYRCDYLETSKRCSEDEPFPPPYISPPPYTHQAQAQVQVHELQLQAHELQLKAHEIQIQAHWVLSQRIQVLRLQAQAERTQSQTQRVKTQVQRLQARQKPNPLCCCYRKPIKDARCGGVCYTFCYNKNRQLDCCPSSLQEYCVSGYVITNSGGVYEDDVCCCTLVCLPCKIVMFSPCFLGANFNHLINCCRNTETNYLF